MTFCAKVLTAVLITGLTPSWALGGQTASDETPSSQEIAPETKDPTMAESELDVTSIFPGDWQITLINTEVVSAEKGITLKLGVGTAEVFTGCNTVTAFHGFASNSGGFFITDTTQNTCAADIMVREKALIEVIENVNYLTTVANTALAFYDTHNGLIMAAARAEP